MRSSSRYLLSATFVGLLSAMPAMLAPTLAQAPSGASAPAERHIDLADGRINLGYAVKPPSAEAARKIPSPEDALAAMLMSGQVQPAVGPKASAALPATADMTKETKDAQATAGGPQVTNASNEAMRNGTESGNGGKPAQPSVGTKAGDELPAADNMRKETKDAQATAGGPQVTNASNDAMRNGTGTGDAGKGQASATAGKAPADNAAAPSGGAQQVTESQGPIGATAQTMPSTLSPRNDVLDRVPTMAMPMKLSREDRQRIFQTLMADESKPTTTGDRLGPADMLSTDQAMNDMHPLPDSLQQIGLLSGLSFIKTKDKVLLVAPATRVVMDQITKS